MDFFRKYFPVVLGIVLGLVAIATIVPYFVEKEQVVQPVESVQETEVPFEHEGNLSVIAPDGTLKTTFEIEFAQGEYETSLGLMYRKTMEANRGMLFIFSEEEERSFWMKNTYIPLDIVYINAQKQIVSIFKNAKPLDESSCPSNAPAMYALELNAGTCEKLGIQVGDTINYDAL